MRNHSESCSPVATTKLLSTRTRVGLQKHLLSLRRKPSPSEKAEVLERRRRLMLRITSFERKGNAFLKLDEDVQWMGDADEEEEDDDSYRSEVSNVEEVPEIMPETRLLAVPSSLAPGEIDQLGLVDLARQEAELRRGQINNALEGLRMVLGEKSLYYRTDVRNNKSQRTSVRAWQNVNKQDAIARQHKWTYDRARKALIRLDLDREYLSTLHDITVGDMKMAGDVTDENRFGQRSSTLAWFWRVGGDSGMDDIEMNPRMKECECTWVIILCVVSQIHSLSCELVESQSLV